MNERVEELFRRQVAEWPLLSAGVAALAGARTRDLSRGGRGPRVRHIPHRVASTTARVDPASIARRPCFLCPENLFPEQRSLDFGGGLALLCNPFPVVDRHLTVVHREHRDQRLGGRVDELLGLAEALPGFFVLYNGPRCGASAPDHLHFQAGTLAELPIVSVVSRQPGPVVDAWGARALLLRGPRPAVAGRTEEALALLAAVVPQEPEPWCNVVAWREPDGGLALLLFPRAKHRPDSFHRGELTVSPAAIDLSGLLVAPVERDFERLTEAEARAVFAEVTIGEEAFREVVGRLEAR